MNKSFSLRGFHIILLIGISALLGYFFGVNKVNFSLKDYKPIVSVQAKNPPPGSNLDMTLFYQVLEKVNKDYYDRSKIDSKKVLYGAISGMLSSLDDPYTSFFPPKENTSFKTQLSGEFSGIGAELGTDDNNHIMVVSPLDGSPSEKAGVKSGDLILKVNDEETTGWSLGQAVEKIRGPRGSEVSLVMLRQGAKTPFEVKIVRDTIQVKSVTSWVKKINCDNNSCKESENCNDCASVGYIRLSQFGDKTNDEWVAAVNKLTAEANQKKNFKGVILDLRNNPGGYLSDAVFIASEFLKKNDVVVMQEDNTQDRRPMVVTRPGVLLETPLLVLINKGSASASEIVAGALRDYNRARLVGEKSFGKGTVQEAVEVDSGASVHVSVAKWLTPNGTWVNKAGLTPDIPVTYEQPAKGYVGFDNQLKKAIDTLLK